MTDKCISPLRRRMIEDMTVRNFAPKTQNDYIRAVITLTKFLGRSPDTATAEDLRLFQLHLTENRVGAPTINFTVTVLRFLFTVTLDRADAIKHLTFVPESRKIPVVLSPEEVVRLFSSFCATGGALHDQRPGCSQGVTRFNLFRPARSTGPVMPPLPWPGSPSG
jgi:integrase/recombinase XerD